MTTYSDLRRTLDKAMRQAEEAYVRMRDEDGASDEALTAGRQCQDTLTTAWRLAGILADDH